MTSVTTPITQAINVVRLRGNQPTLGKAIELADQELVGYKAVPAEDWHEKYQYGGINYGQKKESHFPLQSLKGKATSKYGHVVIERLDSGSYEVVVYVL